MRYTWGEIQILALQKMFLNNDVLIVDDLEAYREDRKYKLYLNSIAAVANEGLLRIMSVGRPLIKKYTLSFDMPDEVVDYGSHETRTVLTDDLEIEGAISKAYYFEINGDATIKIQKDVAGTWTDVETITHLATTTGTYETYKGLISNTEDKIRLLFEGEDYLYSVRNIALYNCSFPTEDDVLPYTNKQRYDLGAMISDLYEIVSIEFEKDNTKGSYTGDYVFEGDNTLVIDSKLKGNFIITYKAYPVKITDNTPDSYRFTQPAEMMALLPLYIASELYKDDDISQATIYRNEFEIALMNIRRIEEPLEFTSNSNWL